MNEASSAASAASTAFPPARRMPAPASAVRGWPAATMPRPATPNLPTESELRHELGHVDVDAAARAGADRLAIAPHARLAQRLAKRLALARRRVRSVAVAGGDHGDPDLVLELLVDHRAEDDVGLGMRGLLHGAGGLVDLPQREVAPGGDRQQDRLRALKPPLQQRRARRLRRGLDRPLLALAHADAEQRA